MKYLYLIIAFFLLPFVCQAKTVSNWNDTHALTAQDKEKKKKEKKEKKPKKPFNWEDVRPEKLSGNADMDKYLLSCDTLWTRIQSYRDSISFFQLDTVIAQDAEGNKMLVVKITDEEGNPRNFSKSFAQGADLVFAGTGILLDATNIALQTTNATMALTSNPLLAFSYGKCLKAGPIITKLAYQEVKEIMDRTKAQMKVTKSMRASKMEGSTDQAYLLPIEGALPDDAVIENLADIDLGNSEGEIDIDELDVALEETELPEEK